MAVFYSATLTFIFSFKTIDDKNVVMFMYRSPIYGKAPNLNRDPF